MIPMISLDNSVLVLPQTIQNSAELDTTSVLQASLHVRRKAHANGMDLQQYADAVIAGTQPTLDRPSFNEHFGATQEDISAATAFLESNGLNITWSSQPGACLYFSGTAAQMNSAFGITLKSYDTGSSTFMAYDGALHLPPDIHPIVENIKGLNDIGRLRPYYVMSPQPNGKARLDPSVAHLTPLQAAEAYQMPSGDGAGQTIGIISFGGGYLPSDVTNSFSGISVVPPTVTDVSFNGAVNSPGDGADVENMLDIFCAGAVAPAAHIVIYFSPNTLGNFGDVLNYAIHDEIRNPTIMTISWGTDELDFQYYGVLFESVLQAAAVLGVTVMQACGDYGSEAVSGDTASTVQYPSSSPYCLGIGGTTLTLDGSNNIVSEIVWDQGNASTGGGLSHIFNRPSFQDGLSYTTYNSGVTGSPTSLNKRGVPDISANAAPASGYTFYANGYHYIGVGGTSASSPLLAGCFARLQAKTRSGKKLGFPAALFYSNTAMFRDTVSGNNASPATTGYAATAGWDACTGLGSPIGTELFKKTNTGTAFPKLVVGQRPASGVTYPRPHIRN